jgi:hypothetical protein
LGLQRFTIEASANQSLSGLSNAQSQQHFGLLTFKARQVFIA